MKTSGRKTPNNLNHERYILKLEQTPYSKDDRVRRERVRRQYLERQIQNDITVLGRIVFTKI